MSALDTIRDYDPLRAEEALFDEVKHPRGRAGKWVQSARGKVVLDADPKLHTDMLGARLSWDVSPSDDENHYVELYGGEWTRSREKMVDSTWRDVGSGTTKISVGQAMDHVHPARVASAHLRMANAIGGTQGASMKRSLKKALSDRGLTIQESVVDFNPTLHPRDRKGEFADVLGRLKVRHVAGTGLEIHVKNRPGARDEFPKGTRVILPGGREGIIAHTSSNGRDVVTRDGDATGYKQAEYAVSVRDPNPLPGHHGYGMEYVKHNDLRYHPDEMEARHDRADEMAAKAAKGGEPKRPFRPVQHPVTLNARVVPDDWQVEHGYADWASTRDSRSGRGLGAEPSNWARLKPGVDVERMIFHYLSGKPAPPNPTPGTQAWEQWTYGMQGVKGGAKAPGKKADREALLRKITQALDARAADDLDGYALALTEACELRATAGPVFEVDDYDPLFVEEAVSSAIHFDPTLHPRNRKGEFTGVLARLQRGVEVHLPHGITVTKGRIGGYKVDHPGGASHAMDAEAAAHHALTVHDNRERPPTTRLMSPGQADALGLWKPGERGVDALSDTSPERLAKERTDRVLARRRDARAAVTGSGSKAQALVDSGLADDLADARAQLADMGEGGRLSSGGERVMGSDAAVAVGRFKEGGPDGYKAAGWPDAKLRKRRETAVEDQRKWLENRHRDFSTGDLPDVKDFKYLSDAQVTQLAERVIPQARGAVHDQSVPGEYRRDLAGEANRRATRRRNSDAPVGGMGSPGGQRDDAYPVDPASPAGHLLDELADVRHAGDHARAAAILTTLKNDHGLTDTKIDRALALGDWGLTTPLGRASPGGERQVRADALQAGHTYIDRSWLHPEGKPSKIVKVETKDDTSHLGIDEQTGLPFKEVHVTFDDGAKLVASPHEMHTIRADGAASPGGERTARAYLDEKVKFGGEHLPRGEVMRRLGVAANAQYPGQPMRAQTLVDRYMQGLDAGSAARGMGSPGGERGDSGAHVWSGPRIDGLRQIVSRHQAHEIDGMLVDATTANLLVKVYDSLRPENQAKFGSVPLPQLVDFAWSVAA